MKPLVTAHSGCENTIPNSIESVLAAISGGADSAEVDVRITVDKIPVLCHDDFFLCRKNPAGKNSSGTAKSISENSYDSIEGIVRLEEVLLIAKENGIILNLDIKDFNPACMTEVMKLLKKHNALSYSVFSGFSPGQVITLRKTYPAAGFMVNISEDFVSGEILSLYKSNQESFINILTDIHRETGGICLNISRNYCGPPVIERLAKRFVPVTVWTVDSEGQMKTFAEEGAYSITTRNVRELVSILN